MEKVDPIIDILKHIVASGFVKNGYPLSAILISNVGSGKTSMLKEISINDNILFMTDVTPYGFTRIYQAKKDEFKTGKITHLIIPDLVVPLSRGSKVVSSFLAFMNSLIEEGIYKIETYFISISEPVKLGLITSITTHDFIRKKSEWLGMGFISRMIPITYSYTDIDRIEILRKIAKQEIEDIKYEKLSVEAKNIEPNPEIFEQLIPFAQILDKQFEEVQKTKIEPYRRQKQLEILLMANALLRGDDKVTEKDYEWFKSIAKWINFDFNPL